jgi:hypothetical protein
MSNENIIFTTEEKKSRKKREPKVKEPKVKEPKPKKQTTKKTKPTKTLAQMQREFPKEIIVPVGKTAKCPKGTRKNKEGLCVLTKEFKDTFLKRKICIQNQRDKLQEMSDV